MAARSPSRTRDAPRWLPALAAWPPYASLPPELGAALAQAAAVREFKRGQAVWREGEPATHFYLILRGLVKIVHPTAGGGEPIVGIFGQGDSIGDSAVVQRSTYPADALASSHAATLLQLESAPLLRALEAIPATGQAMQRVLLGHTRELREKINITSAGSVPQRLAALLLYLARRFGSAPPAGPWTMPLAISRAELAALAGTTVETTIRTLSRWHRQGLVLPAGRAGLTFPLPQKLEAIVSGESPP